MTDTPRKRKQREAPEYDLQKDCVRWLREQDYLFFAAPVDKYLPGTPQQKGMALQHWRARGFSNGFPDLFVFQMGSTWRMHADLEVTNQTTINGQHPQGMTVGGLGVELKVGNKPLTRYQAAWRDDLRQRGYAFVVVRNLQQLQAYVRLHHGQGVSAELMASVTEAVQLD